MSKGVTSSIQAAESKVTYDKYAVRGKELIDKLSAIETNSQDISLEIIKKCAKLVKEKAWLNIDKDGYRALSFAIKHYLTNNDTQLDKPLENLVKLIIYSTRGGYGSHAYEDIKLSSSESAAPVSSSESAAPVSSSESAAPVSSSDSAAPIFSSEALRGETAAVELYSAIVVNKGEISSGIFTNINFGKLGEILSVFAKYYDIVKSDVRSDDYKIVKSGEAWQALEAEAEAEAEGFYQSLVSDDGLLGVSA